MAGQFVHDLITAVEKSARIARAIRAETELFKLLVEEKSDKDKNQRFVQDFKTLADVLIQETLRFDIGTKYPEIAGSIQGEESNHFSNQVGESVVLQLTSDKDNTRKLLSAVLNGNERASGLLADAVHTEVATPFNPKLEALRGQLLNFDSLGIWIDPIDGTNEYIKGENKSYNPKMIQLSGLACVTVLVGVYLKSTGEPIIGVLNQPFYSYDEMSQIWKGRYFWGYCYSGLSATSVEPVPYSMDPVTPYTTTACSGRIAKDTPGDDIVVITSSSDFLELRRKLAINAEIYRIEEAAGAGYKLLCVITGLADLYVLIKPSAYYWDTCSPHAVLRSIGGNIIPFAQAAERNRAFSILYNSTGDYDQSNSRGIDQWCHTNGLIAFRSWNTVVSIVKTLTTRKVNGTEPSETSGI